MLIRAAEMVYALKKSEKLLHQARENNAIHFVASELERAQRLFNWLEDRSILASGFEKLPHPSAKKGGA
jgi:hypothetical protein